MPNEIKNLRDALQLRDFLRYVNLMQVAVSPEEAERLIVLIPPAAALLERATIDLRSNAMVALARVDLKLATKLADMG